MLCQFFGSKMICLAVLSVAVVGGGTTQAADEQNKDQQFEIVKIASTNPQSKHWIGVYATPVDEALKLHLDLEDHLIVQSVVKGGPAEKAGVRKHDILLKLDDTNLSNLADLSQALDKVGESAAILTVIRKGGSKELEITPAVRPPGEVELDWDSTEVRDAMSKWLDQSQKLQLNRGPFRLHVLGPGMFLRDESVVEHQNIDGKELKIAIERDGQKSTITVKRNGEEWKVTEDDLDALPEDIRNRVKELLEKHAQESGRTKRVRIRNLQTDGNVEVEATEDAAAGAGEQLGRIVISESTPTVLRELSKIQSELGQIGLEQITRELQQLRKDIQQLREDLNNQ